ncbi:hypothetical protein GCM10011508_23020 [Flavobacterium lutivivi]|nr:hypothetical protein GCM10011508_23020 [Flavobacterium lutivivi]
MKKIFTIIISLIAINAIGQTLKSFNGPFTDGKTQNGTAVYTYYEDPDTREYLKQGAFKYTFNGKGDYQGYDQTITGNFEKGLKHGTWTYTIIMTDFGSGNPYYTGTVTLVANYKNGYADGNWKEVRSYKQRKKFLSYGQYKWDPFGPVKTMTINMNFKNGYLVGAVSINDEFANFKATGSYDNNGLAIGTWIINDMGWGKNRELIYKDNYLYEFVARSNQGEVLEGSTKYQKGYDNLDSAKSMTPTEREEAGISIDTICGGSCAATNNIQEYFNKLLVNDYFLYDFIKGDLTYKEGIKGGCDIQVRQTNFTALSENSDFKNAEDAFNKGELIKAYDFYSKIKLDNIKPSERSKVTGKIAELNPKVEALIESYHANGEFFQQYIKSQYDSLVADFNSTKKSFKIKTVKEYDKYTYQYVDKKPTRIGYGEYVNPWDEQYAENATKCFETNKEFYEPYQRAITEYYFKFDKALDAEESAVKKSSMSITFNKTNHTFYAYDKQVFLKNIATAKENYNKAKSMMSLSLKFDENVKQIEKLNDENKKKTLFTKYSLVLADFQTKYNAYPSLDECINILNEANSFLAKVISLYSTDTKELEKQLKSAETVEQIKSIILGK